MRVRLGPLAGTPEAVDGRALRVLVFVEARGLTGAVRNLLDVARTARTSGIPICWDLATYRRAGESDRPGGVLDCVHAARDAGLTAHVLDERRPGDPSLVARLRGLVRAVDPDVVETQHVKSHLLAAVAGVPRDRWIAVHHGYTATSLGVRAANLLDLWTLRRPARVVTPCAAFAEQLTRRGLRRDRIAVIHNAVVPASEDSSISRRLRAGLGVPPHGALIVCVGRLSREKAQSVLIAALAQPHLGGGRPTVLFVGEGPERERLARQAQRQGVAARVRFAGYQEDPWPFIHAADAIALPSDSEGSPNALLEAMAAGKPVVATRVGGVPEIVEDGRNGLLVPRRSPVALARALSELLRNPERAESLGRAAREDVLTRFGIGARAQALANVYRQVCACIC